MIEERFLNLTGKTVEEKVEILKPYIEDEGYVASPCIESDIFYLNTTRMGSKQILHNYTIEEHNEMVNDDDLCQNETFIEIEV